MENTENKKAMEKLVKKVKIKVEIELKTGLHIGAGNDKVQIGGLDNPVIRAVLKGNQPIIPGSSLKGKIRSLLEQTRGVACISKEYQHPEGEDCPICKIFGGVYAKKPQASRLIFRDLYLTDKSKRELEEADLDYPYAEIKNETAIDRITGTAKGGALRNIERIPAGAIFEGEIIVNVKESSKVKEGDIKEYLELGFFLLNNDYLGGSGSRGYGHIELKVTDITEYSITEISWKKEEGSNGIWEELKEKFRLTSKEKL